MANIFFRPKPLQYFLIIEMRVLTLLLLFFAFVFATQSNAQCINIFPHTETFESSASWTSGGINSDWAWGSPAKGTINGAGGGSKCWIVGGLNGTTYNGSEKSYIESPCYDLSALTSPYVSFKIFWETERQYDGASLLYTLNNGASWNLVGAVNEPANCMTQNWYNYSNINYLAWSNTGGWSGNSKITSGNCQGGGGSLGWVIAKHCLGNLAGKTNVKFRFNFGSGTSCNSYDGFAIDDFTIGDAGNNLSSFTYTCSNFSVATPTCTQGMSYSWNFGDPSSANNTSTLSTPTHIFTEPGIYNVSLTLSGGPCNAVATTTQQVSVIGSSVTTVSNVACFGGANGGAAVSAMYGQAPYTYNWLPFGGTNATANSLSAGTYTVLISDAKNCVSSLTVSVGQPAISTGLSTQTLTNCLGDNTLLQVNLSGVTDPVSFLWLPGSFTTSSISVSPASTTVYSVNVVISGNCPISEQKLYTVMVVPKPIVASINSKLEGCAPLCVTLEDKSSTQGTIIQNVWSFNNGNNSALSVVNMCFEKAGTYAGVHSVTNSYGCTSTKYDFISINVYPQPIAQFEADNTEVSELNSLITFKDLTKGSILKWEWNFGGEGSSIEKDPVYNFNAIGEYPVLLTVTNEFDCSNTARQLIKVLPEFTFFAPNSFTPNGDGLNDIFLPKGMGWDITNYDLAIYDRWGQKIFHTTNPAQGWDGTLKGNLETTIGGYIYKALVYDNYKKVHEYTGSVTIIK